MLKKVSLISGLTLAIAGVLFVLSMSSGFTGYAVFNGLEKGAGSILGFVLIIGGILIFAAGRQGLEKIVDPEVKSFRRWLEKQQHKTVSYGEAEKLYYKQWKSEEELTPLQIRDLTKAGLMTKHEVLSQIQKNYSTGNGRVAHNFERAYKEIDSHFKTRDERLKEMESKAEGDKLYKNYVLNPIKEGTGTYVYYNRTARIKSVEENGLSTREGKKQEHFAIYFPTMDAAKKYVENTPEKRVKSNTGAKHTESAIIFRTSVIPDVAKLQSKVLSGAHYKAIFREDVLRAGMYDVSIKKAA